MVLQCMRLTCLTSPTSAPNSMTSILQSITHRSAGIYFSKIAASTQQKVISYPCQMASESNQPYAFNPTGVGLPPPTYKQVAITPLLATSKLVTLAGMTGFDHTRPDNPSSVTGQAPIAFDKIKKALAAAGATPRDIVQVKHYIVQNTGDPEVDKLDVVDRGWGEAWMEFMDREGDGHRPPDTVVGVASLAKSGILYECEVWAIIH